MTRLLLLAFSLVLTVGLDAQDGTSPTGKDGEVTPTRNGTEGIKNVLVSGSYDIAPAPPSCADTEGDGRLNCLSTEVLAAVRKRMDQGAQASGPHARPVSISFAIDQFGDMKDIRVEHTGSSELPKKVIVALYALPKFIPAKKDGASVGTTVSISYPYEALFVED
ncbi:MAG: hypothetical protein KDC00_09010 [Flavobacteriales bacterium]|nr:hypothetical protein [Flavobacteriales bacterium]